MDCAICFCEIDGTPVKCSDDVCATVICQNCMISYIGVEGATLRCPRSGCDGEYDEISIAPLTEENKRRYRRWLLDSYKKKNKKDIERKTTETVVFERLREDRKKFYQDAMPLAVRRVAEIAFASRLRRVPREQVETEKGRSKRLCINLFCRGYIDETMTCSTCKSIFCEKCEEVVLDKHVCKKENIESLAYINSLVPCPSCGTKVEKGEGCMAITCVCGANFWYSTGEKGEAGNHGATIPVNIVKSRKLSVEYHALLEELGFLEIVKKLEHRFVTFSEKVSFSSLISAAAKIGAHGSFVNDDDLKPFSANYAKYNRQNSVISNVSKKMAMVEKLLIDREDGFKEKIYNVLTQGERRVLVSDIELHLPFVIITNSRVFDSVYGAAVATRLNVSDIFRALSSPDGIVKKWKIEYE